ncbi:MAG TPA: FAD-dependent oxidoreductase [Acetobacteraceae bacterium]|nr:FAD-dependent oxidoreductase [Acetobacteraceae bacterium]
MSTRGGIYHPDFKPLPYWWEAWKPEAEEPQPLPRRARVAIIGAGYAGLSTALELARAGIDSVVLEAGAPGSGASTRNGGAVSGGVNVGKSFTGRSLAMGPDRTRELLSGAAEAFTLIDALIGREDIDCFWEKRGRFVGAWTPEHYRRLAARMGGLNEAAQSGARMVPRARQREEIASDYYYGGMVVERAGKLHPALYYRGLLEACRRQGVTIAAMTAVRRIAHDAALSADRAWRVQTTRGDIEAAEVVVATNGYTGDATPALKRKVLPIASHIIATEELPEDLARALIPNGRTLSDTRRVLTYYRMSPDGRRLIFGGRARFTNVDAAVSAPILHRFMTARFPELRDARVAHAWAGNVAVTFDALPHMGREAGLHYCLGCNGSGVAMMTYLGWQTARKIANGANRASAFDRDELPGFPLYRGNPWFLPAVGGWFRLRDEIDRRFARMREGGA